MIHVGEVTGASGRPYNGPLNNDRASPARVRQAFLYLGVRNSKYYSVVERGRGKGGRERGGGGRGMNGERGRRLHKVTPTGLCSGPFFVFFHIYLSDYLRSYQCFSFAGRGGGPPKRHVNGLLK